MAYPRILQRLFANAGAGPKLLSTIIPFGTAADTVCQGNDARLTNARTPTAHKAMHQTGGADALTPADIGAAPQSAGPYLCEFYFFRHPTLRPGFQPAQGGLLEHAATLYPEAWAYLQTTEGQMLCVTEAEWQAMTRATWATLADGTTVGWNGIGGAPYYVIDMATGTLRLPDLRGMYAEAAGFDALGVGGVHGDAIRNIVGQFASHILHHQWAGAFWNGTVHEPTASASFGDVNWTGSGFDASRMVPVANKNQGRAWGALACVYLGAPK